MILEALKNQAQTDRICAVDERGEALSFHALHRRSDALAACLLEKLPPKVPVLLIGDKENEMLTCLFACMKSGRAYVPLTPSIPEKRAAFMAEHSEAGLIIAFHSELLSTSSLTRWTEKDIEEVLRAYEGAEVSENDWIQQDDMMALLYTSGSTGTPKGVINCLGDLENLFLAPEEYYIGGPGMRVMNNFSYMFSAHMQHVYRTMTLMGSVLYAVPGAIQKDVSRLVDHYLLVQPDFLGIIATTCAMLLTDSRFCEKEMPQLRGIALAGEVCSRKLIQGVFERFPRITVRIQYASTELTTVAVGHSLTKEEFDHAATDLIPIGKPVPSIEVMLVDEEGKEVPEGEKGELVVLATRLCDGYWKEKEQTDRAFFELSDGRRGFRTRDLMVRRDGLLYYAGRLDNRIKIGGNRVEMEEVETAVTSLSSVHQCVVRPVQKEGERVTALVAYVTLCDSSKGPLESMMRIKKDLKEMLPAYMIPQKIVILPEFKTNTSGKVDRAYMRQYHEKLMALSGDGV